MQYIKPRVVDPLMVKYYGSLMSLEKAYKAADADELFLHVEHLQLLLKMAEAATNNVARRAENHRQ